LDHLVILMTFGCLYHINSEVHAYSWTMSSRELLLGIIKVLIFLIAWIRSEMNFSSFLLFLTIVCYLSWMNSSVITILMVRGAWLDRYQMSVLMLWLLISMKLGQ